jgi:hypothetical protein
MEAFLAGRAVESPAVVVFPSAVLSVGWDVRSASPSSSLNERRSLAAFFFFRGGCSSKPFRGVSALCFANQHRPVVCSNINSPVADLISARRAGTRRAWFESSKGSILSLFLFLLEDLCPALSKVGKVYKTDGLRLEELLWRGGLVGKRPRRRSA